MDKRVIVGCNKKLNSDVANKLFSNDVLIVNDNLTSLTSASEVIVVIDNEKFNYSWMLCMKLIKQKIQKIKVVSNKKLYLDGLVLLEERAGYRVHQLNIDAKLLALSKEPIKKQYHYFKMLKRRLKLPKVHCFKKWHFTKFNWIASFLLASFIWLVGSGLLYLPINFQLLDINYLQKSLEPTFINLANFINLFSSLLVQYGLVFIAYYLLWFYLKRTNYFNALINYLSKTKRVNLLADLWDVNKGLLNKSIYNPMYYIVVLILLNHFKIAYANIWWWLIYVMMVFIIMIINKYLPEKQVIVSDIQKVKPSWYNLKYEFLKQLKKLGRQLINYVIPVILVVSLLPSLNIVVPLLGIFNPLNTLLIVDTNIVLLFLILVMPIFNLKETSEINKFILLMWLIVVLIVSI